MGGGEKVSLGELDEAGSGVIRRSEVSEEVQGEEGGEMTTSQGREEEEAPFFLFFIVKATSNSALLLNV